MTSQLFQDATAALREANKYSVFSPEHREGVGRAHELLRRVTMEVWDKEERDRARETAATLLAYLDVPWEDLDAIEVRYWDGSTEVLYPKSDPDAAAKIHWATAMRVVDAWDYGDGA